MSEFKITPFPRHQPEPTQQKKKVVVITDGACSGNPGPGGWGVILRFGDVTKELHGGDPDTTNNRMEITAVIQALNALREPCDVEIVSDSEYVINTQTKGWKRKKNNDLWQALDAALLPHKVTWKWVRGHNGHDDNERADELARMGIAEARQSGSRKSVT